MDLAKTVLSAAVCFAVTGALYKLLKGSLSGGMAESLILGIICGAAGFAVYAAVLYVTGESDIRKILKKE